MLKILMIIAIVLLVGVAGLVAYAATRPDTFRIERSTLINAPADTVHAILTDLRRGREWSPFERKDPNLKRSFSGPETGVGSALEWEGDMNVGAGKLSIAQATPSKITLNLDMRKPMEGHNIVEYALATQGDATHLTWSMHGKMNLIAKVMCIFINLEKDLGSEFEKGLRDLKALAERQAAATTTVIN
jgi:hypothetical protein